MLGDTAVAVHPDPTPAIKHLIGRDQVRLPLMPTGLIPIIADAILV